MFGLPDIKGDVAQAMKDAPSNFAMGMVQAVSFIPNEMKGAFLFGKGVWENMTPEQKATCEAAVAKLLIAASEAYVKKGS